MSRYSGSHGKTRQSAPCPERRRGWHPLIVAHLWLAFATGAALPAMGDERQTPVGGFHVEQTEDSLQITLGGQGIAEYVFRHDEVKRPFFAHVRTPSGIQVTRNFPPVEGRDPTDHATMHPGIWLGFANVNGVNFWHNDDGRVVHDVFDLEPRPGDTVRFTTRERYVDAGSQEVARAVSRYQILQVPDGWLLTVDVAMRGKEPLVFTVKEEMGFGLRVATALTVKQGGGSILSARGGRDERGTWGKHDHWWDYFGTIDGHDSGMMLMSHPSNPPIWSHSRDYGLLVANPFAVDNAENRGQRQVVPPSATLRLRFGLLVHEETGDAELDRTAAYQRYIATSN